MSNAMIYAGIAVGVAAMTGIMVYATDNQSNYLSDDAIPQAATTEGVVIPSDSGLAPALNKEQWHQDPFGDLAQKVREQNGR